MPNLSYKARAFTGPLETHFPLRLQDHLSLPVGYEPLSLAIDRVYLNYAEGTNRECSFPADMRTFNRVVLENDPWSPILKEGEEDPYRYFIGEYRFEPTRAHQEGVVYGIALRLRYDPRTGAVEGESRLLRDGGEDSASPVTHVCLGYLFRYTHPL